MNGKHDESDLLFLTEVAEYARVSLKTVRHWVETGRLSSLRFGRRRMVRRKDLDRFVATPVTQHRASPLSEV
jgi:excisionase family DNA binding protein